MILRDFIKQLERGGRANYFVLCPDNLGLNLILPKILAKFLAQEDIKFFDALAVTKDKAREMEGEARKAPVGLSAHTYFVITGMQRLPRDSVGPMLKVVEEARYACFLFQAQRIVPHLRTLLSRSQLIQLPFMPKKVVFANMQALHHDARTADELGLYDGTITGTIRAVQIKDTVVEIRREIKRGVRGLATITTDAVVASPAFLTAVGPMLTDEQESFLLREDTPDRRKLIAFALCGTSS